MKGAAVQAVREFMIAHEATTERHLSIAEVVERVAQDTGLTAALVMAAVGVMVERGLLRCVTLPGGDFVALAESWSELTRRERQVAIMMCAGLERGEMAARAGVSRKTIDTHRRAVLHKCGVGNEVLLLRLAVSRGWVWVELEGAS